MAHAPAAPTAAEPASTAPAGGHGSTDHQAKVTPGKFAIWLFLATEVMFFTGLIGSYIVLRTGSQPRYSNFFAPGADLTRQADAKGVLLSAVGAHQSEVVEIIKSAAGVSESQAHHLVESAPAGVVLGVSALKAAEVRDRLAAAGATAEVTGLKVHRWPVPYDPATNPLSIDLTAANTFILICSSVTMVLALGAVQRGDQARFKFFLGATAVIGATFLGIQIYEYRSLMFTHHYPIGVSKTGHFTPDASLFASCFFTMTGFHGAHVAGGVVMLTCIFIGSLMGRFTRAHHSAVELIGLYWHFVDLVWIILFTVVYLV